MSYKDFKYPLFESSPLAKSFIESYEDLKGPKVQLRGPNYFKWNEMKIGQSFVVPVDRITKSVLKNMAAQKPKWLGKTFKVIEHKEHKLFEVARIK